jgi:hypothetical protein
MDSIIAKSRLSSLNGIRAGAASASDRDSARRPGRADTAYE